MQVILSHCTDHGMSHHIAFITLHSNTVHHMSHINTRYDITAHYPAPD